MRFVHLATGAGAAVILMTTGCNLLGLIETLTPPPPSTLSSFADFGVTEYAANDLYIPPSSYDPDTIATDFGTDLQSLDANQTTSPRDGSVTGSVLAGAEAGNDEFWFSGHGEPGMLELTDAEESGAPTNLSAWGFGPTSGGYTTSTQGFPAGGRLKWIFAYASGAVGLPAAQLTAYPTWTTNWSGAFGGSLHGIYGFAFQPGTCPDGSAGAPAEPGSVCDIDNLTGPDFAANLSQHLLGSAPQETVHGAWINAANDVGFGGMWSMWEGRQQFIRPSQRPGKRRFISERDR